MDNPDGDQRRRRRPGGVRPIPPRLRRLAGRHPGAGAQLGADSALVPSPDRFRRHKGPLAGQPRTGHRRLLHRCQSTPAAIRPGRATSSVAWTQARARIAVALVGEADTVRLTEALPLLGQAAELVRREGAALLAGRSSRGPGAGQRRRSLHEGARALRPAFGTTQIGDTAILEQQTPELADDLSATILNITDNAIRRLRRPDGYRALAAYISDTIIGRNLAGALKEPWHLIGIEGDPPSFEELRLALEDTRDVVSELANNDADIDKIRQAARSGKPSGALQRGAKSCRAADERRQQKRLKRVQSACRATGRHAIVFDYDRGWSPVREYRISVTLDSLVQWHEAVDELTTALRPDQEAGETYLFVPLRNSQPIPGMAFSLINNLWPTPNPSGLDKLPEAHATRLIGIFNQAVFALQELSGIHDLPEEQQAHNKVQDAIEASSSKLGGAVEQLMGMSDDRAVDALLSGIGYFCARVQAEQDGTSLELSIAAQCARALHTEEQTNESAWIYMAQCLASEWDAGAPLCDVEQLIELVDLEAESE